MTGTRDGTTNMILSIEQPAYLTISCAVLPSQRQRVSSAAGQLLAQREPVLPCLGMAERSLHMQLKQVEQCVSGKALRIEIPAGA